MDSIERSTMAKVSRRLIPFVIICYFVAFLDRVNVSFAALEMNKDLKFTSTVYGLGAGIFFISYFLLETSSNTTLALWKHAEKSADGSVGNDKEPQAERTAWR
jgi:ACS family tartrate transporter-like MFS transporter